MSRGDQFILAQDITEQTRLEGQLRQAQKMEAIGTLAGGIAHDFNNILSAIMGYTELSKFEALDGSPIMDKLNEILKASHRAKDMVKQILAFSRQNPQEHIPIQISPIVKEALKMLRGSLPTTIEIRQHMDNGIGIVKADATQIHQVLMNLSTNAAHAMNENGGILDISVTDVDVNRVEAARHADLSQGPYVRLTVSDTGEGISKEVMERIFEPYFTTKEKGVGTGLGLAVTHGIVKGHGGAITLESKPGKGSTFNVYIPRIEKGVTPEHEATEIFPAARERILFVDDEQVLVEVGKQMLEKLGHEVTTRTNSIEALELFRVKPDQFDLVITDMTMPNMTGDKLAKEIMGIRADIPIVLCTGYSEHIGRESAEQIGIRGFVMKPLSMNELANAIRNGIDKNCYHKATIPIPIRQS
jgi:nitrogen-specific signal transduction histidine kinase/ActR/RegA family two-component response regulator